MRLIFIIFFLDDIIHHEEFGDILSFVTGYKTVILFRVFTNDYNFHG